MEPKLISSLAALLGAVAWPISALVAVAMLSAVALWLATQGSAVRVKFKEIAEFSVEPARGLRAPSSVTPDGPQMGHAVQEIAGTVSNVLPLDYYFLNHSSFVRREKQEEFRQRTGVALDHYDIRVIVDSYYRGALDHVEYVEYILHRSYPEPIQYRRDHQKKFLLEELAYGEYVLMAKVFLKSRKDPVLLQRYITLHESGPRLI